MSEYDYLFQIYLFGNSGVGKTSLLHRFTEGTFADAFIPTIGVNIKSKTITLDNKIIKLQIWDTSFRARFRTIYPSHYRGTHGVILVYDVTDTQSFDDVRHWLLGINSSNQLPKLLVGNKGDLVDRKVVNYSTSKEFADSLNVPFLETSAKDAINIEKAFVIMASQIKSYFDNETQVPTLGKAQDSIYPGKKLGIEKSRCCC